MEGVFYGGGVLENVKGRMVNKIREGIERNGEENLGKEEIEGVIMRMKEKKAAKMDEITNKVWKYEEKRLKE